VSHESRYWCRGERAEVQRVKTRHKRLALIAVGVTGLTAAALFAANAFRSNIVFFFSPTEIVEGKAPAGKVFRIGGLVEQGSVKRSADGLEVEFAVTDNRQRIPVRYEGILPDLFREGQGVVAQGRLDGGRFQAHEVLAKHDENYMPPEAAKALQASAEASKP
jgi:cytochrome c-type biogenesis protein CcmE